MAKLRLVPPTGDPIEITQDKAVVGRDPSCDIHLSDGSVSRKHAVVERRGATWAVVDQGSANGTFLDSQRVAETMLHPGQELRFGAIAFRVEMESDGPDETLLPQAPEATVVQPAVAPPPRPIPPPPPPRPSPPPPPLPKLDPRDRTTDALPPPPPLRTGAGAPRFPPPPSAPVPSMGVGAPPLKKGRGPVFWIASGCCGCLALVALVATIGVFAFLRISAEPVAVIREQLQEIKQGDRNAAYAKLSESYRAQLSREEFDALVESHPAMKDNRDSSFFSRSVSNDTARLSGFLVSATGGREPVTYELVKDAGGWRISAIRFFNE